MPVVWSTNPEGERVQRYDWPATRFEWTDAMFESVAAARKEASQTLGLVASVKELKRDQLRIQRAAGCVLAGLGAGSDMWPVELATELDWLASIMENTRDGR